MNLPVLKSKRSSSIQKTTKNDFIQKEEVRSFVKKKDSFWMSFQISHYKRYVIRKFFFPNDFKHIRWLNIFNGNKVHQILPPMVDYAWFLNCINYQNVTQLWSMKTERIKKFLNCHTKQVELKHDMFFFKLVQAIKLEHFKLSFSEIIQKLNSTQT